MILWMRSSTRDKEQIQEIRKEKRKQIKMQAAIWFRLI
jgi:hypothetical protein